MPQLPFAVRTLASLVAAVALFAPLASEAGADHGAPASCTFNADGSGWCSGTLAGFRFSADPTNFLVLQEYADTGFTERYISVKFNGIYRHIYVVPSNTHIWKAFDQAGSLLNPNIYFHWNASNTCDALQVYNSSGYYRGH
jgi:hypothetical protein